MLKNLGHDVYGIGLNPPKNGMFELASVKTVCSADIRLDIRNKEALDAEVDRVQPEIVLHLAAQALVLTSYEQIYETYSTNVAGTLNVLDSSLKSEHLKGIIVVTSDKVYEQRKKKVYVETDILGGKDPYSSSKALADKLTQDWSMQNKSISVGIARAGNVIGGGDVSSNRLIPDIFAAAQENRPPIIRNPNSVRPWQHVLDCLNGYVKLMDFVASGHSGIFNFGPAAGELYSVRDVVNYMSKVFDIENWVLLKANEDKEAKNLAINSAKAFSTLNWENKLTFHRSLDLTLEWYFPFSNLESKRELSMRQIDNFLETFNAVDGTGE